MKEPKDFERIAREVVRDTDPSSSLSSREQSVATALWVAYLAGITDLVDRSADILVEIVRAQVEGKPPGS